MKKIYQKNINKRLCLRFIPQPVVINKRRSRSNPEIKERPLELRERVKGGL